MRKQTSQKMPFDSKQLKYKEDNPGHIFIFSFSREKIKLELITEKRM